MNFDEIIDAVEGANASNEAKCLVCLSHEIFDNKNSSVIRMEEHTTGCSVVNINWTEKVLCLTLSFNEDDMEQLNLFWGITQSCDVLDSQETNADHIHYLRLLLIPKEYNGALMLDATCPAFTHLCAGSPGSLPLALSFIFDIEDVIINENDEVDIDAIESEASREIDIEEEMEEMLEARYQEKEENYQRRLDLAKKYSRR